VRYVHYIRLYVIQGTDFGTSRKPPQAVQITHLPYRPVISVEGCKLHTA